MTNQELFKQAIADAKSVRDAAVANAKAALEETFTPQIMAMLSTKLNEMEDDEDMKDEAKKVEEEGYEKTEEGHEAEISFGPSMQKTSIEGKNTEEEGKMEETDLEEILAQLEAEEKGDKGDEGKMEEGKDKEEKGKKEVEEAKKKDNDKKKVEESLDEAESDDEITELTVDELKDIIRDVLKDVMGGEFEAGEEAGEEEEAGKEEEETEDEESISLDELLAELDKEDDKKSVEEKKDKEEDGKKVEEAKKDKKDLDEAIKTIRFLQSELNEVNLLNAKLLYTNKIFKTKTLSEVQKIKVVKSLDKASNVKEAKTIYETLVESLTSRVKSNIRESVGFASKAVGIAPKQPIVESDSAVRRMQQLAGIIK